MRQTPLGIDNDFNEKTLQCLVRPGTLASILGISVKMLHKLVREGKLSCVQVTTRERRFTPEQVHQYIESQSTGIRVDKKAAPTVSSRPKKGGTKSPGDIGTDLVKEIRSLCR
jgi:excisionase family DNA binding protein